MLAFGYDGVMAHVEYDFWARYVQRFIERYCPDARRVIELGCGTGTFARELLKLAPYELTGIDLSPEMILVARRKAEESGIKARFEVGDFTTCTVERPVDAALLLYDGLNYQLEIEGVRRLLRNTWNALRPGGIFIFDQSTPANSINNERYFEDQDEIEGFAWLRRSRFDPATRLHTTSFDISYAGDVYHEEHVQRAYSLQEIEPVILETGFVVLAAFRDFSMRKASESAERIHWIVRRPQ